MPKPGHCSWLSPPPPRAGECPPAPPATLCNGGCSRLDCELWEGRDQAALVPSGSVLAPRSGPGTQQALSHWVMGEQTGRGGCGQSRASGVQKDRLRKRVPGACRTPASSEAPSLCEASRVAVTAAGTAGGGGVGRKHQSQTAPRPGWHPQLLAPLLSVPTFTAPFTSPLLKPGLGPATSHHCRKHSPGIYPAAH